MASNAARLQERVRKAKERTVRRRLHTTVRAVNQQKAVLQVEGAGVE